MQNLPHEGVEPSPKQISDQQNSSEVIAEHLQEIAANSRQMFLQEKNHDLKVGDTAPGQLKFELS